jgi:Right handed beta helix region
MWFMKLWLLCCMLLETFSAACLGINLKEDGYHVFPGDNIQDALQQAAANKSNKIVKVHAGEYRPNSKRQALIWFNRMHDGVRLEAVGPVTLTAANPEIISPQAPGFPAVVNHVVYFGDGISSNTVLRGFRLTGANHFVTEKLTKQMEPDTTVPKNLFFYTDGGAIKIFGRSYPTIQNLEVMDNYASPCGAGISVQHMGFNQNSVSIENCVFLRNRAQVTGAAIDLLDGSAARIINCLFVGNGSNTGEDVVAKRSGEKPFTNSGVLTIFQNSRALARNCTFAGNRNAVDDMAGQSAYVNCIFFDNNLAAGLKETERYELDLPRGAKVSGCFINGVIRDPGHSVSSNENVLNAPSPKFNKDFVPEAPEYKAAGYRPVSAPTASSENR